MKYSARATIVGAACFACTLAVSMADTRYVDISNPTPVAPFTSWATAANDIQSAVDAAVNGDTVLVADGVYVLTAQVLMKKSLTVQSLNGPSATIINANGNSRAVRISAYSGPCSLRGLTITGGYAQGGSAVWADGDGPIEIIDCLIDNNTSTQNAGGISIRAISGQLMTALIRNCVISNNRATGHGGGLYATILSGASGSITVEDCTISENVSAKDGGGIWSSAPSGSVQISRCLFLSNEATRDGGGIRCMYNILLRDSLIVGNMAGRNGGGEHGGLVGNSYIVNCTLASNQAVNKGGGVNRSTVINSIVYNNSAGNHTDISADSLIFNSCASNIAGGTGSNITNAPMFLDPGNGDYRLQATSPCIDRITHKSSA
jgi:predicted outer membrane repeat protein